jgi:hypothetical protein
MRKYCCICNKETMAVTSSTEGVVCVICGKNYVENMKSKEENKMTKVNFNESDVKQYLDNAIRKWRKILKDETHEHNHMAIYYCDAFQSVRVSLFGELLPKESVK